MWLILALPRGADEQAVLRLNKGNTEDENDQRIGILKGICEDLGGEFPLESKNDVNSTPRAENGQRNLDPQSDF